MPNKLDLSGKRFGRLIAISACGYAGPHIVWKCICDCGVEKVVRATSLSLGATQSCGCLRIKMPRTRVGPDHRYALEIPEYRVWSGMKNRCYNPNERRFRHYGGRGIIVCERWKNDFSAFYEDMGPRPTDKHTIERVDVNGNYCPENCIWLEGRFQNSNRQNSKKNRQLMEAK
jgi:hypothetical protein